ncbi:MULTISPECIES: helix-turn-helix domain-containing protein [unclassified Rathayibacter]|uniref:helix-turn-helix transcriptional regulator n=1 Tax=unclassified Rathayibacter TaxID=2609250 RepID=UPI002B268D68|nr:MULTISPECIES: helix-turn-helix domain-containing protein [unclassified Rathayibacter]
MTATEKLAVVSILLTLPETAEMLRKSEAQLRWMIQTKTAPRSAVIGGRRMFRRADVDDFITKAFEDAS